MNINLQDPNEVNLTFSLSLPNQDTVQVGMSFRLLTYTHPEAPGNTSFSTTETISVNDDECSSSSPEEPPQATTELIPERTFVTVGETIEGFRQKLIRKESQIAGIIENSKIFYKHFKLEYDEDKELTIRCTYDINYEARILSIACYEYHKVNRQRLLSNGEVGIFDSSDINGIDSYQLNVELVDLKSVKQTYKMAIS